MARIARVIAPGVPHHVIQRGNRRQTTFFDPNDYEVYLSLMEEWCDKCHVEIWAYCLMSNHVHLIAVPETEDDLRRAIGEAHRRYTRHVNFKQGWRGHLWQGRFSSYPMDEAYCLAAARYVELNPVKAKMVERAEDYPWSSAKAHLLKEDDGLVRVAPLLGMVSHWGEFLATGVKEAEERAFNRHERTGRPLGDGDFVKELERRLGRRLIPRKPGPSAK